MSGTNTLMQGGEASATSAGGTCYAGVSGGYRIFVTSEAPYEQVMPGAATLSNLGVCMTASSGSAVATFRQNGANGNQTITIASGFNGWATNSTHADAITAGNTADLLYGGGITQVISVTVQMNTSSRSCTYTTTSSATSNNPIGFSTTLQHPQIFGTDSGSGNTTSESNITLTNLGAAGTLGRLGMLVYTASSGTISAGSSIGGATGNQALSIASGTGTFQDTTHTDAIAANTDCDSYCSSTSASGGWFTINYLFTGATAAHDIGIAGDGANTLGAYTAIVGCGPAGFGQADTQAGVPFGATSSRFRARQVNTGSSGTLNFQVGGANGNQTVAILSATTGLVSDATHTDPLSAAALINVAGSGPDVASMLITLNDGSFSAGVARHRLIEA